MNENPRIIGPMSSRLREALAEEIAKDEYLGLDEELATIQAAEVLLQRQQESLEPIFDLTNTADRMVMSLASMG